MGKPSLTVVGLGKSAGGTRKERSGIGGRLSTPLQPDLRSSHGGLT
ncbi:hypothetical protein [Stygiolobus caldivivus]|nr:hypothetical protein [Stygiolobus caldivivus]